MENVTDKFQEIVWNHLLALAEADESFQEKLYHNDKNITECCKYIIGEVKKTGRVGFADEEIYAMAVHYFVEEEINIESSLEGIRVVVNERIENKRHVVNSPRKTKEKGKEEKLSLFSEEDYEA